MAPSSSRPTRRAKLTNVDYAVLTSGQQIPEFSSEDDASDDEDEGWGRASSHRSRRRGRHDSSPTNSKRRTKPRSCFVCHGTSRSAFSQCDICSRWFHDNCRRVDDVRSVLANTSCHECLKESVVTAKSALPRKKLDTIADLVKILSQAKKILVVAGAGISVSCGIPDFRSKDGIYEMVKHMDVALPEPECLFHIDYFREDPSPFFQLVQSVFGTSPVPSATHEFLKLLQDKGKLLRVYSQNIDGLETVAGVTKYIPCHGTFAWSSCMRCKARVDTHSLLPVIEAGVIPTCSALNCRGVLKPEITFFGEILDDTVSTSITKDRLEADLILVMGTSLKVSPVAEIPSFVPDHIPQVVINKTPLKKKRLKTDSNDPRPFDLQLLGDCDTIVRMLCNEVKWSLPGTSTDGSKATKSPPLTVHKDSKRVCVGVCECEGVADGALGTKPKLKNPPPPGNDEFEDFEVISCDACGEAVTSDSAGAPSSVYSCTECFDYDLCASCYADGSKRHFSGTHKFKRTQCQS